jgi:O-Antigen ligase
MSGLTAESAILGALVLTLVVMLSVGFSIRPSGAIPLLLLAEMPNSTYVTPGVRIGQLHIYPEDVLAVAMAAATLLRLQRRGHGLRPGRRLVILLAVLVLGVARGAAAFGLQSSIVDARGMLYFLTAAVFFSTVRLTPQLVRRMRNWLLLASGVLTVVAISFWAQHGFGTYVTSGARALDSLQALIILEATIFTVVVPPFRGRVLRWVPSLVGILVVVLSIQRTVWAAGLVAAAVLVVTRQRTEKTTSKAAPRVLVVLAALAVLLLAAAGPSSVTSDLAAGYQQTSTSQTSTFNWRLQGWSILIDRQVDGPRADLVLGSPSGTGYDRFINGSTVTVAPHSEYVSALEETGLIGLVLLVWVYASAITRSRRRLRSPTAFVSQIALLFMALLALQLTDFVAYSQGAIAGMMLGLALGMGSGREEQIPGGQQQDLHAYDYQDATLDDTNEDAPIVPGHKS